MIQKDSKNKKELSNIWVLLAPFYYAVFKTEKYCYWLKQNSMEGAYNELRSLEKAEHVLTI